LDKEMSNALDELTERRNEALAGRGEALTSLERAVVHYDSCEAAEEYAALKAERDALKSLVEYIQSCEYEEVTGECVFGCGGCAADGHAEGCVGIDIEEALKAGEK
jgi:primase-polymerase (primpol)-like protein